MLTETLLDDIILLVSERYMQRYRSGHNEAVLKTVCPQGRVGSNPTLCVNYLKPLSESLAAFFYLIGNCFAISYKVKTHFV